MEWDKEVFPICGMGDVRAPERTVVWQGIYPMAWSRSSLPGDFKAAREAGHTLKVGVGECRRQVRFSYYSK